MRTAHSSRRNVVRVVGFTLLVSVFVLLAAKSWEPPSVCRAPNQQELRQALGAPVVAGLGRTALDLKPAAKSLVIRDSGASLTYTIVLTAAFLILAIGGWVFLPRVRPGSNWRLLGASMIILSLPCAYFMTAAAMTFVGRPNATMCRKERELRLVVNTWGSPRHEEIITIDSDPRIILYSEYARRAFHDVVLVWRTSRGVEGLWLASDFEDYQRALQFARAVSHGLDLPLERADE